MIEKAIKQDELDDEGIAKNSKSDFACMKKKGPSDKEREKEEDKLKDKEATDPYIPKSEMGADMMGAMAGDDGIPGEGEEPEEPEDPKKKKKKEK